MELDHTYDDLPINNIIIEYKIDIIVYISGFITWKLQKQIYCFECKIALKNNLMKSSLIDIKNRGDLVPPSRDTFIICKSIKSIVFILNIENKPINYNIKGLNYESLKLISEKNTFNEIINHSFFANEPVYNHRIIIIKNIIKPYINIRMYQIAKNSKWK